MMDKVRKRRKKMKRLVWDYEIESMLGQIISWEKASRIAALICEKYDVLGVP